MFIHAFPLNRNFWSAEVEALGKEGYHVIAIDLPGFGGSLHTERQAGFGPDCGGSFIRKENTRKTGSDLAVK